MTNAWFLGAAQSVPQSEEEVRSTVEPIRVDNISAEMQHAPDWNELDTDESGELIGLSPRQVSGNTHDSERYLPWWTAKASTNLNKITDEQVASSGTAAAREMAGIQGHGTLQYTETIEPIIREGAKFGNDYFTALPSVIQEGAGEYMTPVQESNWYSAVAQSAAVDGQRKASQATLYGNLLDFS